MAKELSKRKKKPLTVVFVCTANICRSPMAEGILKNLISSNESKSRFRILSAGVAAMEGDSASSLAQEVCRDEGIDISEHSSQPVSKRLLKQADVVLVMTPSHKTEIVTTYSDCSDKVFMLKEYGRKGRCGRDDAIADPYGGNKETYEVCFLRLRSEIMRILPELAREAKK